MRQPRTTGAHWRSSLKQKTLRNYLWGIYSLTVHWINFSTSFTLYFGPNLSHVNDLTLDLKSSKEKFILTIKIINLMQMFPCVTIINNFILYLLYIANKVDYDFQKYYKSLGTNPSFWSATNSIISHSWQSEKQVLYGTSKNNIFQNILIQAWKR